MPDSISMSDNQPVQSTPGSDRYVTTNTTRSVRSMPSDSSVTETTQKEIEASVEKQMTEAAETQETGAGDVSATVEQLNRVLDAMNKQIQFRVSDETDEMYVRVVDGSTGEVIRSIPPESLLRFRARFEEALGMIIDSTA